MSYDLYSGIHQCDHRIVLEPYHISYTDFRTLQYSQLPHPVVNMRAPINAPSKVSVFIKGVQVPADHPTYGYTCVIDTDYVQSGAYTWYKIMFNHPVRLCDALVQVSYYTRQGTCKKCGGTGQVTDWRIAHDAGLETVSKSQKLAQQILKYVLTSRNPFNPNLVCPIRGYLGKKWSSSIGNQDIISAVNQVLASYMSIQSAQQTVQSLDYQEMLKSVDSVVVVRDQTDPTMLYITLGVSTFGSNQPVTVNLALQTIVT